MREKAVTLSILYNYGVNNISYFKNSRQLLSSLSFSLSLFSPSLCTILDNGSPHFPIFCNKRQGNSYTWSSVISFLFVASVLPAIYTNVSSRFLATFFCLSWHRQEIKFIIIAATRKRELLSLDLIISDTRKRELSSVDLIIKDTRNRDLLSLHLKRKQVDWPE